MLVPLCLKVICWSYNSQWDAIRGIQELIISPSLWYSKNKVAEKQKNAATDMDSIGPLILDFQLPDQFKPSFLNCDS